MKETLQDAFEQAASSNYWSQPDSLSGPGSSMFQTRIIRQAIPALLEKHSIGSMLDAPCGDLFWMKTILPELEKKGIQYQGADIVSSLIEKHKADYKNSNIVFHHIDLTTGPIPKVDLIFTRDCFIHLSYKNIYSILKNYKKSGSKYLLVNTYTKPSRQNCNVNDFYLYGRYLNMEKFPFYFGKPVALINEGCTENDGINDDKSLGLWEIEKVNLNKIRQRLMLFYFPELFTQLFNKSTAFSKRVKSFIKRKVST